MRITVLTLFPEMYRDFVSTSIIGRAIERGLVTVDFVQIRDFAHDHYRHVDDKPFGGGLGQVMKSTSIGRTQFCKDRKQLQYDDVTSGQCL